MIGLLIVGLLAAILVTLLGAWPALAALGPQISMALGISGIFIGALLVFVFPIFLYREWRIDREAIRIRRLAEAEADPAWGIDQDD